MGRLERNRLAIWIGLGLGCLAGLSAPGAALGQSIILHLRNGDRLTGVLLLDEPRQVTFSNAVVGRLVVSRTEIDRTERITNIVVATSTSAAGTNAAAT